MFQVLSNPESHLQELKSCMRLRGSWLPTPVLGHRMMRYTELKWIHLRIASVLLQRTPAYDIYQLLPAVNRQSMNNILFLRSNKLLIGHLLLHFGKFQTRNKNLISSKKTNTFQAGNLKKHCLQSPAPKSFSKEKHILQWEQCPELCFEKVLKIQRRNLFECCDSLLQSNSIAARCIRTVARKFSIRGLCICAGGGLTF